MDVPKENMQGIISEVSYFPVLLNGILKVIKKSLLFGRMVFCLLILKANRFLGCNYGKIYEAL